MAILACSVMAALSEYNSGKPGGQDQQDIDVRVEVFHGWILVRSVWYGMTEL